MPEYQTVEQKSSEWCISTRHIQYLCRNGKIKGAMKHAGVWFIPKETSSPAKYTRHGAGNHVFTGTKKRIFNNAIKLFMTSGFNGVTLRDIAESVGIRQSAIYNHFKSKQELLDSIYDFFCRYYPADRRSMEEMEHLLETESIENVIKGMTYSFSPEYEESLLDITSIIFQRLSIDDRAKEIARVMIRDEGLKFVEDIFKRAIETGKIPPADTQALALIICSIRFFMLFNWFVDPSAETAAKNKISEDTIYKYLDRFLANGAEPLYDRCDLTTRE